MVPCLDCNIACRGPRCSTHQRQHKAKYNAQHRRTRADWVPLVATGTVECWRCRKLIVGPFDLGHRPGRESLPEHPRCNRAAH
jgi:hypothetical protein